MVFLCSEISIILNNYIMFQTILSIIENIVKLICFWKTDAKVIESKERELKQATYDGFKKDIDNSHRSDNLDNIRRKLG